MLRSYLQRTRLLLADELFTVYRDPDLADYLNEGRNQIAAEAECVVATGTLNIAPPVQNYPFSAITLPADAVAAGVGSVQKVRLCRFVVGDGAVLVYPRAWEWFQIYTLDKVVPTPGYPIEFAQHGQGQFGTLWFNPPDGPYTVNPDVVCLPVTLDDETTSEALPLLWTIAVPFYAAWRALLTTPAPQQDPDKMMERYKQLMAMARSGANPELLGSIWSQAPDIVMQNRYGLAAARGGQGG